MTRTGHWLRALKNKAVAQPPVVALENPAIDKAPFEDTQTPNRLRTHFDAASRHGRFPRMQRRVAAAVMQAFFDASIVEEVGKPTADVVSVIEPQKTETCPWLQT